MVKSEKGAIPVLNVMLDVFSNMPKEYYVDNFSEFKTNVETHLLPLLFKTKNKLKKPQFVDRDQNEIVVQVLVQIGMKRSAPVIDFIRSMFSDAAQEENPKGRMRCLAVLGQGQYRTKSKRSTMNCFRFYSLFFWERASTSAKLSWLFSRSR